MFSTYNRFEIIVSESLQLRNLPLLVGRVSLCSLQIIALKLLCQSRYCYKICPCSSEVLRSEINYTVDMKMLPIIDWQCDSFQLSNDCVILIFLLDVESASLPSTDKCTETTRATCGSGTCDPKNGQCVCPRGQIYTQVFSKCIPGENYSPCYVC